jgi:hypothetical protein
MGTFIYLFDNYNYNCVWHSVEVAKDYEST